MDKERFERPKGWQIPTAEIRIENENLFAHYDIEKEDNPFSDSRPLMGDADSENDSYVACYIRIPHVATMDSIREAVEKNGCEDAENIAREIYVLYREAYK